MGKRLFYVLIWLCCVASNVWGNDLTPFPLNFDSLIEFSFESFKPHEAKPEGVPTGYDWASKPRLGAGNKSTGYLAATGWGQAFYIDKSAATVLSSLAVRNFQTYVCYESGDKVDWVQHQNGVITGNQFRADFLDNKNEKPITFDATDQFANIAFKRQTAFHFWPKLGRFNLISKNLCGFLVMLEAKQTSGEPNTLLIGLGADYWLSRTAVWDNYRTNKDVAIGRLKHAYPVHTG